jgi:hypothetical protein
MPRKRHRTANSRRMSRMRAFDKEFNNWIQSALAADWYEKRGKPVPPAWKKRLDRGREWVENLSAEDYDRLIH